VRQDQPGGRTGQRRSSIHVDTDQHDINREAEGNAGHRDRGKQQRAHYALAAETVAGKSNAGRHTEKQAARSGGKAKFEAGPNGSAEDGWNFGVPGQRVGVRRKQDQLPVEHAEVEGQHKGHAGQMADYKSELKSRSSVDKLLGELIRGYQKDRARQKVDDIGQRLSACGLSV
jgi:hypothetical protein